MASKPLLFVLAFTVTGCALCQESPDRAAYAYFFAQVASLRTAADHPPTVSIGSDGSARSAPTVQEVVGISDAEAQILRKIAADWNAASDALQESRRGLIFDSRLEFIETGKHSETLEKKLKDLDERSDELVMNHVRQLKAALPDASFAKVDAYVRTPLNGRKSLALMTERKAVPEGADEASAIPVKKK
jgi:hypothetical protein